MIAGVSLGLAFFSGKLHRSDLVEVPYSAFRISATAPTAQESTASSQAQAASISAVNKEQVLDARSPSTEQMLSQLPIDILRKAYYKKMETIEKQSIESRFKAPHSQADRKAHRETLFNELLEVVGQSNYWLAKSSLVIDGKPMSVTLLLKFYDSAHITENSVASDNKDPENFCWDLATFFGDEPTDQWAGSSSCLESISKAGNEYYIVQMLNLDSIEPKFSHLAAPILSGRDGFLEMLDTKTQKWQKNSRLDWTPISRTEVEQIQKDRRTSEVD